MNLKEKELIKKSIEISEQFLKAYQTEDAQLKEEEENIRQTLLKLLDKDISHFNFSRNLTNDAISLGDIVNRRNFLKKMILNYTNILQELLP